MTPEEEVTVIATIA